MGIEQRREFLPTNKFLVTELYCSFAINCFGLFRMKKKNYVYIFFVNVFALPFIASYCRFAWRMYIKWETGRWMSMRVIENAKCSQYIYCFDIVNWTDREMQVKFTKWYTFVCVCMSWWMIQQLNSKTITELRILWFKTNCHMHE